MTAGSRSQQPGMPWVILRPSVDERPHDGTCGVPLLKDQHPESEAETSTTGTPTPRCESLAKPRSGSLRDDRRKRCDPVEVCALGRRIRDMIRAVRGACRISHQLDAIRSLSFVETAITACSRKDQRPALVLWRANSTEEGRRTERSRIANLRSDWRSDRGEMNVKRCKIANFREVRVVSLSDFVCERHAELSCVRFFAVFAASYVDSL